ncbi:hypothetical protein [Pannonibacter indicus]|uniref:hypothetical protein n=1 Tax=Pannonibacter indicus TaxID=466044 RepID=UPI00391A9F9F
MSNILTISKKAAEKPDPVKMNDAYRELVLRLFAETEHEEQREFKALRAEVERTARKRL